MQYNCCETTGREEHKQSSQAQQNWMQQILSRFLLLTLFSQHWRCCLAGENGPFFLIVEQNKQLVNGTTNQ